MIRIGMKTFSHLFKDTCFRKLLQRPVARFLLGLILERECANFGPTPVFVDRARLYTVRLRGITSYLDKICCSEEGMAQIISKLRIPAVFDTSYSSVLIRQSMSVGNYVPRLASSIVYPRTVATPAFISQTAESKLATPRQTSTAFEVKPQTMLESRPSVPVASGINLLQQITPVRPAQTVRRVHALSSQTQPIINQVTQLVDATTHTVNTNGSPAILGAIPQGDAMEDCVSEPTHSQQAVTTDPHARLPQPMDGVETSAASSHGTNDGQDKMDDVRITGQPTAVPPATNLAQDQNQNMSDAPPLAKATHDSTVRSNVAPSSTMPVETKDQDMPDISPLAHSTLRLAIQPNLSLPATISVNDRDQDMTDAPPPAQTTLVSSRSASEARDVTAPSYMTRFERPTSGYPLAPTSFRPSFGQPSAASSFSGPNDTESTIQSRAKARAQANPHNHWSNGKAHALFMEFPKLHQDLQKAHPNMIKEPQRNQFKQEVLDYIQYARSAVELRDNINYAMMNKLLTNAEFNKLTRYARDGRHARRREAQENAGMLNAGSSPTNHQIDFSQTATDNTAQPSNLATLPRSSGVITIDSARPASLVAPPQTAIANANGAGLLPVRHVREEPETPGSESSEKKLTQLLIDARRKMMIRNDPVSTMFASMFNVSWHKPDVDIMVEYLIKRPRFKYRDSNGLGKVDIEATIEKIQTLVEENTASSYEEIVWMCKEALSAQDVKAEDETLHRFANCEIRTKWLGALFERISATNFALVKEVHPNGCLTWDEMKNLARTEELGCFNKSLNTKSLLPYQCMKEKIAFWGDRKNMKKLVADRIAAQHMTTGEASVSGPAVSSKAKRNIADISFDHDKVSEEKDVDAMDDDETRVPEANGPALKRFREAPTNQEVRAAIKEKNARRFDDSGGSDRMKRSRE